MKTQLRSAIAPAIVVGLVAAGCAPDSDAPQDSAPAPPPPNVIVVLADDLGYGDIGANGSTVISTPHIDELAANGVRLTDGYVSAAVCSPMRAGLFTGRYQNRFGYEYNPTANYERNADAELGLPEDETTLGDMMREAGYATGLVGKWHLGFREQYHPLKRGFDEFFGHLGGGTSYVDPNDPDAHSWPRREPASTEPRTIGPATPVTGDRGDGPRAILDGYEVVEVDEYLTDVFADRAVSLHRAPRGRAVLPDAGAERAPHADSGHDQVRRPLRAHRGRRGAHLRGHGLVRRRHGGPRHSDAQGARTGREHARRVHLRQRLHQLHAGRHLHEFAALRRQALSPGRRHPGAVPGQVAGGPAPGRGLQPARERPRPVRDVCRRGGRLLPEEDYAPVWAHGQTTVLHDLEADVGERVNVADQHPEVVERLEAALAAWEAELAEPMWISKRSTLAELHGEAVQLYF